MLKFFFLVNKQGQTRISQYYEYTELDERVGLEAEIVRKCLARSENQCSFMEYKNFKVVYRRYAALYFIVGIDSTENELGVLEFVHNFVEILDKYFDGVIMFNIDKVYMILDEMIMNGHIVEGNKSRVLAPIVELDKVSK
ncbi:hypothetical protein QZH41_011762 [Actinostola sp. cb2023]|nr:hypothetical protein QZH41_011762 [Actinostola sp. cb2023]